MTRFDGLSEFISRRGRMELLEMLVRKKGSVSEVAEGLDITEPAVCGWRNKADRHPSNKNVQKMIELLAREDKKDAKEFLLGELQIFQDLIFNF